MDIFLAQIDKQINDGSVQMSQVLQTLGRKAVVGIAQLAQNATKEEVKLRANIDLADRSPETAKTHKLQLETDVQLTPSSIDALRNSLLESARARAEYDSAATGDFVTVSEESLPRHLALIPTDRSHLLGEGDSGSGPPDPG